MPIHAVRAARRDGEVGANVLLCGASRREDVGDTRYRGSELVVRKLTEMGAEMRVHETYGYHWYELENRAECPGRPQAPNFPRT